MEILTDFRSAVLLLFLSVLTALLLSSSHQDSSVGIVKARTEAQALAVRGLFISRGSSLGGGTLFEFTPWATGQTSHLVISAKHSFAKEFDNATGDVGLLLSKECLEDEHCDKSTSYLAPDLPGVKQRLEEMSAGSSAERGQPK
jgi:hypothetical protein